MGPNARTRIICDQFIAGHTNSALQRHLDSVPPETPIRDIVDRCWVWESHANTDDWRVVKPTLERAQPVYAVSWPFGGISRPRNDAETSASGRTWPQNDARWETETDLVWMFSHRDQ